MANQCPRRAIEPSYQFEAYMEHHEIPETWQPSATSQFYSICTLKNGVPRLSITILYLSTLYGDVNLGGQAFQYFPACLFQRRRFHQGETHYEADLGMHEGAFSPLQAHRASRTQA